MPSSSSSSSSAAAQVVVRAAPRDRSLPIIADVDAVYNTFKDWVAGQELSAANMVTLVVRAMRLAEEVARRTGDKGRAKKEMVLRLLERLINDARELSAEAKVALQTIVATVVPPMIDGLIEADHGRLLAHARSAWQRLTSCCRA